MNKQTSIEAGDVAEPLSTQEAATVARRPSTRTVLMLAVPLLIAAVGLFFWATAGRSVSTDNAYVKQDIVSISTQVNGPVAEVYVDENQAVKRGDPLYLIDPAPLRVALANAEAQLAAARLSTRQLGVQAAGTGADITGAAASLAIAERALDRQRQLLSQGFTTKVRYDDALDDVAKARTALADAKARAATANAAIAPAGEQPSIAAAEAAIAKARLDLQHALVRAPVDGIVAKSDRLLPGQTAITGVAMLSIVRSKGGWVEANFKEGDLAKMAVGQTAIVKFDAYPGLEVAGHVASIGSGTGSEFSVLPAQNANGNWVKVTQRVPVRIAFDEAPGRKMIAGLSAEVEVRFDGHR